VKSDVEECAVTGRIHHVTSSVISAHEYKKVPSFCVAKITRHKPEAEGKSVGMPLPTHVQMDGQPEHILPLDPSIALIEALTLGMPQFCAKTEDSARVIFTNSAQRFCIFSANSAHFFRKEKKMQTYEHFSLTLNDIRINRKITTRNEIFRHLLHRPGT